MIVIQDVSSNIQKYKEEFPNSKITFYSLNEIALSGYIPFEYSEEIRIIFTDVFCPKEDDSLVCVIPYHSIFDYNTRKTYFIFSDSFNTVYCIENTQEAIFFKINIKDWYAKNILSKWHKGLFEASLQRFQFDPLFSSEKQLLFYKEEELKYLYNISV